MKRFFKIGCGCLGALILITIVLIVIIESCNSSGSKPIPKEANENDSFKLPYDETVNWERKTAEVKNTTTREYLENYLKENGLSQGFDPQKQTFCCITTCGFKLKCSPSDRSFVMRHANQISRAAFQALLKNLYEFAEFLEKKEPTTEKIKNGEKITIAAELRLKNIVFKGKKTASNQKSDNDNIAADLTESFQLFYKENKLLEYVLDGRREKIFMVRMSMNIRGILSETDRWSLLPPFMNLLISDGLPVVMEHTAYFWDEKNKRGEVSLLLVYKINPDNKDQ